jgi:hypothetical protein
MGSLRLEQGLFSLGMPISHETILRVRSRMSWMSDPAEEQISHSEEDHGFGDVEALLVIADQPALCISSRLAFPTSSACLLDAAITLQPKETGHLDPGSSHRWSSTPTLCAPSCLRARWRRASWRGAVALGVPDHRHGTDDQHLAQIPIACLGDAAQAHLVARGVRGSHLAVTLRFLLPGQRRMVTRR